MTRQQLLTSCSKVCMVQALRWACGSTKFYLHRQLALVNKVVRCTELIETKALSAHTDAADCLKPIDEKAILIMSNKDFPSCSLCSCEVPFGPIMDGVYCSRPLLMQALKGLQLAKACMNEGCALRQSSLCSDRGYARKLERVIVIAPRLFGPSGRTNIYMTTGSTSYHQAVEAL